MIILLAIAVVVVGALLAGFVLVSLASLREDSAHSLAYRPGGPLQAAARRVLGFHGDAVGRRPGGKLGVRGHRGKGGIDEGPGGDDGFDLDGLTVSDDVLTGGADSVADRPAVPYLVS
jgi:hypothetical protein